jgi:hypothetical protein
MSRYFSPTHLSQLEEIGLTLLQALGNPTQPQRHVNLYEPIYQKLGLLYLNPKHRKRRAPIIDRLTRKITAAYRQAESWLTHVGEHYCSCGAVSSNWDMVLPNGLITNSLCIHYVALHRRELSVRELQLVRALRAGEVEPTADELQIRPYPEA